MATNNTVTLIGNLGQDPQVIDNDGQNFVALSLCTRDSYKDGDEWKDKAPVWHKVLVFGRIAQEHAKGQKKGNRVKITGSLSYRPVKGANGYDINEATIIGRQIELAPLAKRS